jgi:hypothetical protein
VGRAVDDHIADVDTQARLPDLKHVRFRTVNHEAIRAGKVMI